MAIEDYLEKYTAHCKKKKMTPLAGLVKKLTEAIDTGDLIEEFVLKGNIPELKMNRINDDAVDPIVHPLSSLGFLKVLDLSFNELGDKGATNIAKYIKNDSVLEVLILKSNKIGSNGIISISKALHYNSQICYLDLSNNTIGDEGGMAVANMMQVNASITNLFISGCKLPATSLIAIATVLQANNYIQQLDMSNNMLSTGTLSQTLQNDVMTHISTSIAMNYGIKVLNLSKSGISDYIMCHLLAPAMKANRNIETLDLSW
ncbi:hypothetical protein BC833DRAFT_523398 [Globomyces pollinis-pini]|nr:hypothetical protein BC833DRAFT_523398 [Globomyces pollinis-pini]